MAKFITFVCNTCGDEARMMMGPLRSTKDFSPESINSINQERFDKITGQLTKHKDERGCVGRFEFKGAGFAD